MNHIVSKKVNPELIKKYNYRAFRLSMITESF